MANNNNYINSLYLSNLCVLFEREVKAKEGRTSIMYLTEEISIELILI